MSEQVILAVIAALVILIPAFISFRTTSFTEMRNVIALYKEQVDKLEEDIAAARKDRANERAEMDAENKKMIERYDREIQELNTGMKVLEQANETLERQIDNYERWMTLAIAEIKRLGGTPPEWHKS